MPQTMGVLNIELVQSLRDTKAFDHATKEAAHELGHGAMWRCLVAQSIIIYAFAGARLTRGGPEHLAWTTLLLRAFHCLEAARGILSRNADLGAEVLLRVASELRLHQMLIRQPWEAYLATGAPQEGHGATEAWKEVRGRLLAYTAWALASDLEYARARLDQRELEGLFRATRPDELPTDPNEAAILAFAFGQLNIVSEAEAELDRKQAREGWLGHVQRLTHWLADDRLGPWIKRIDNLRERNRGRVTTSFGQLFDDRATSFGSSLGLLSLRHEYAWYSRASRLIHGNTVELFTWKLFDERSNGIRILPRCLPASADAEAIVVDLANSLSQVVTYLWAMRDHVLPASPAAPAP